MYTFAWWLTLLLLIMVPPALLLRAGARPVWMALGVAGYLLGLALKMGLFGIAWVCGYERLAAWPQSALSGLISAAAELAGAALFLRSARLKLPDALAFGAAVGVFELLFLGLFAGAAQLWSEAHVAPTPPAIAQAFGWSFLLERGYTLAGHTASRMLIYLAIRHRWWLPGIATLLLFTLNDGFAAFGELRHWDWSSAVVMLRVHGVLIALTLFECALAGLLWRRAETAGEGMIPDGAIEEVRN